MYLRLKKIGLARLAVFSLLMTVLGAVLFAFVNYSQPDQHIIRPSLDITGIWDFHNGSLSLSNALKADFAEKIEVPKMLPERIRKNLANEFWYRKHFKVPLEFRDEEIAVSLGSVKGNNEVYWNGHYVGSGGLTGYGVYKIPREYRGDDDVTLVVKVAKSETPYPGMVHFYPMSVGPAFAYNYLQGRYYFDHGAKPLLEGSIKLFLFVLFALLLLAMPQRREYLSFALYSLFSTCAAVADSRFMSFYDDFSFRNALMAFMRTASFALIPLLAVQFIRQSRERCTYAFLYGVSVASVFVLAAAMTSGDGRLGVYRIAGEWLALLLILPSAILVGWQATQLRSEYRLRRVQLWLMSASLLAGSVAWSTSAKSYLRFEAFFFWDLLDLTILIGMALAMTLDFTVQHHRSVSAGKIIPKWFSGYVSSGISEAKIEIPLICLAVDTVGYTKLLASLDAEGRKALHQEIREAMQGLTMIYGAQKLTDRGDGALFGWDLPGDVSDGVLQSRIEGACAFLRKFSEGRFKVQFRAGFAAGMVTGEMRDGQFSFLGQALNAACRLEPLAEPGVPLLDASLVHLFESHCGPDWVEVNIKGVVYRGRPLKLVA